MLFFTIPGLVSEFVMKVGISCDQMLDYGGSENQYTLLVVDSGFDGDVSLEIQISYRNCKIYNSIPLTVAQFLEDSRALGTLQG